MAELFTNLATSTLASGISAAALTLTVQSGDGAKYPAPTGGDLFRAVLFKKSTGEVEIITCTARTADVLTITRGEEGTSGLILLAGDLVELRPTAAFFNALSDPSWGGITGTLSNQTDLQAALDLKATNVNLALKADAEDAVLTGNPTAPTPATSDDDTSIATTEFVKNVAAFRGCLVYNNTTTGAAISWTTAEYDTDSIWSSGSILTVPVGVTKIKITAQGWASQVTGMSGRVSKNGLILYKGVPRIQTDSYGPDNVSSPILEVVAGDEFEMSISSGLISTDTLGQTNWFAMEIIR